MLRPRRTSGARLVGGEVPAEIVVEEMLRFDSALQLFERTATADVEVAGQTVGRGREDRRAAGLGQS